MESTDNDNKKFSDKEDSTDHGKNCDDEGDLSRKTETVSSNENLSDESEVRIQEGDDSEKDLKGQMNENTCSDVMKPVESNQITKEILAEDKSEEPVFDGTEVPEMEEMRRSSNQSVELESEVQGSVLNERAVAIKNFVKEKSSLAVSTFMRRISGKKDENEFKIEAEKSDGSECINGEETGSDVELKPKDVQHKSEERIAWNPLSFIKIGRDFDAFITGEAGHGDVVTSLEQPAVKGRIILYTKLGCKDCKMVRLFLHQKRLKYVEINIDIFPSRKLELEKNTGSSTVPKVYFNDLLIGGLNELKNMEDSGIFDNSISPLFKEPSSSSPLPPLPGEDDESGSGKMDELVTIVRKMRESITPKDRFYKMRRFSNCFLGSEAVDFLSEDQYLERDEAVEFGRNLASKYFFRHVLDENVFEDGNHLYRFLDHDPIVMTHCYNIPRGIIDVAPKPIGEVASRLRLLSYAIFEAYVSTDGRHVDYISIQGSEEFRRYIRTIEELQRVEIDSSREEKLAFFINLYNMMAIHALVTCGHPAGPLDRRKFFGDFKYVIGGYAYSMSAIQNGILRGNQRPPYNIAKPFGQKDQRSKVALPYHEPLIHFALVCGTKSGPALRCYSPGDIDKELMEVARDFLRNGGLIVDPKAKVASASKILKWYSTDFGKNETEVLKHASNYLEPAQSEQLLELLASTQLKVLYQPYDWSLNI